MIKIYLEKLGNSNNFKINVKKVCSNRCFDKKLNLKPKLCIGYILEDSKSGFIFAVDFTQLNYWVLKGSQFSKSFLKFSYFLDKFLYKSNL